MKKTNLKVMTFIGTRPEIIRLSRTMALLDEHLNQVIVHTGQNYDYELNEIFFKDLEIRKPDHFLDVDKTSLGASVGDIIRKSEEVLKKENPDAVLVLGDTNSCLAAYMAKRMHIPVFHMEAGNRCFDFNVPEELNRRIIDHISDYNLVYTEHARRHLISEGLPHRRIFLTGSPMYEVLNYYKQKIEASTILQDLSSIINQSPITNHQSPITSHQSPVTNHQSPITNHYFIVSFHREENVDNLQNLNSILDILNLLAENYNLPVIVSTHPRTRKRIEKLSGKNTNKLIHFLKPFGFSDYINLQMNALCAISDSGTISEESAILGFPAISLRNSMERPEAQDSGTIILTGFNPDVVHKSIELSVSEHKSNIHKLIPAEYQVPDTSWRVLKLITGLSHLSNKWHGIENRS